MSAGKLHQTLAVCEMSIVSEGVARFAFVVDERHTSSHNEEFELGRGTTENSYLLFDPADGLEGTGPLLLIDVPEQRFAEVFAQQLAPYVGRIEGFMVTCMDAENGPLLASLIHERRRSGAASPQLPVYCSVSGMKIIKNVVEDEEALALVDFHNITNDSYIPLPCKSATCPGRLDVVATGNPKVPESMGVFDERSGLLISGKFFSAHVAPEAPVENNTWTEYANDWHHFFDCYFFTPAAQEAVRRIFQIAADDSDDGLGLHSADVTALAPRHGPVVRDQTWKLMAKYEAWLERKLSAENEGSVLVLFASAYGNTTTLAQAIERGVAAAGVKTRMLNCEFCSASDIKSAYEQCDALAIGSPTLGGQMPIQMKEALGVILNTAQKGNKQGTSVRSGSSFAARVPCGVFGSFGWSGEAVDELFLRLKDGGFEFAFDPIRCKFAPTEEVLGECEAAGTRLVQKMNDIRRKRKEAIDKKMSKKLESAVAECGLKNAFGTIINSSCVLTMVPEEGKAEIRLPVSWVSQASFTPPGLMLSVEKASLDPFVQLPTEEQFGILFQKYDADGSGEIDREECDAMLDALFGVDPGSVAAEMHRGQKEQAWLLLDADGSGTVDGQELMAAASAGPLAELIAEQRKIACLEAVINGSTDSGPSKFTLSMLPKGMSASQALTANLADKPRPSNGCPAIKGATSFVECTIQAMTSTGNAFVLYANVDAGVLLDEMSNTELLRADHVAIRAAAVRMTGMEVNEPALAACSGRGASTSTVATCLRRLPLAGLSRPVVWAAPRPAARRRYALALDGPEVLSQEETWSGLTPGKTYKLQTLSKQIAADTRTIRSLDRQRDRFDIEFALTNGTTYNAYTIKGDTHTALIDASHKKFEALFMGALESPEGGAVDLATLSYIVVSHTEPDHSGLVENVLRKAQEKGNDGITVVGSKMCITFLKNLVHMDFHAKIVAGGDQIDLGGGHVLHFVITPNLHWPDTMFTYDAKTQLLYTCDAFGMHYCTEDVTDVEGFEALRPHYQLYYNCLMRPNARSVLSAVKKMGELPGEVAAIATGHGPILVESKDRFIASYRSWSEEATTKLGPSVCIFWVSRHGESERLAQALAYGLTTQDILVEMHDLNAIDAAEIVEACHRNQVITVFSPPLGEGIAQTNISSAITSCNAKEHRVVVCASGAEREEPVDSLRSRWVQTGIPEGLPALRMQAGTEERTLQFYEDSGRTLAKTLLSKKKQAEKDKLDQKTMQALGKMAGGRYIVTAARGEVRSACVATWVMPASSEPPSVAVAIAKDHALQSLMQVDDHFVVNMLEEGNYLDLMKHFLQDFRPGEDVFRGVDTFNVAASGITGIGVTGASAYLLCRVDSRMDARDHIIICGEALDGLVVREAPTAANYRKSAAYY